MRLKSLIGVSVLVMSACASAPAPDGGIVLLTRAGCADTDTMRGNLDTAAGAMTPPAEFIVVDLDTLSADDVRRGYPTPTLLFNNRDVFGLAVPTPPLPQPT
ncbi:MAG: hypothetical protein O2917_07760 [Acidobacteria bacterium]|nr:hypothetical protein [Acidobacteriota bacterium]